MNNIISEIELTYKPNFGEGSRVRISNSQDAYKVIIASWNMNTIELREEFKVLLLNRASEVLGVHTLAKGGMSACYVDIKLLLAVAIKSAASSIILVHNHPNGNLKPSEADKIICKKIKKASEYLDVKLLDNLIIVKGEYYSFADRNVL
ncbi:JAB domain-containing protein [Pseudofulvibacter geojedonensis]|uniref:JAB domain-containing protein n=1 Tax=Pseudofulvibacter geojedonensis TaxID=1123758 RepID=A0ABW3I326_9FLAO